MTDIPDEIMERARQIIKDVDEFVVRTDLGMEMIAADIARAIMEAEERGAAREREECAKVVADAATEERDEHKRTGGMHFADAALDAAAAAIRARGA